MPALLAQKRDSSTQNSIWPARGLPMCNQILSIKSYRMHGVLRQVTTWLSFGYSSKCVCANPGSGQILQILLVGAGYGVFLAVLKTKSVLACGPRLDLVYL